MKVSQLTNLIKEALDIAPVDGTRSGNIESLRGSKYTLTGDVKGARIGDRIVTLPKGTLLHNKPGGLFAYTKGRTFMVRQDPKTLQAIEDNSDSLDEITAAQQKYIDKAASKRSKPPKTQFRKDIEGAKRMMDSSRNYSEEEIVKKYGEAAFNAVNADQDVYEVQSKNLEEDNDKIPSYKDPNPAHSMIRARNMALTSAEEDDDVKEAQDSNNKGYIVARDLIAKLRATTFRKFNDDELEEFRKTIADAFDMSLKEEWSKGRQAQLGLGPQSGIFTKGQNVNDPIDLSETKEDLERIAQSLESQFEDLKFDVSNQSDRIDVRGSQQDLSDFGSKLHSKKFGKYEVFATDDDDRGEIVRIVKSDSISKGGVDERVVSDNESPSLKAKIAAEDFMYQFRKTYRIVIGNHGKEAGEEFKNLIKAKIAQLQENTNEIEEKKSNPSMGIVRKKLGKVPKASKVASKKKMKLPTGLVSYMDYSVSEKKDDRCTRIAKSKYDTWPSAYASGAVVRCRKGEIWKGLK